MLSGHVSLLKRENKIPRQVETSDVHSIFNLQSKPDSITPYQPKVQIKYVWCYMFITSKILITL